MAKLLFIRYKKSKDILEGGEQGSQKNYNVLARLLGEENITTIYVHDETRKRSIFEYVFGLWWMLFGYYFGLSPKRVKKMIYDVQFTIYDYIWIDRSVFGVIAKKLKKAAYKGEIFCFFHNVEVPYFSAKIPKWQPQRSFVLRCVDRNDKYSCRYADKIIVLNRRDAQEIEKRYCRKADVLIPVAFKDKYQATNCYRRIDLQFHNSETSDLRRNEDFTPICLFVGAYFRPNNEGIKWFLKNVYPYVNIKMQIAGKGMAKLRNEIEIPPEINLSSDVPDLLPFFEEADLVILPIFEGAGMKVKTCESLMYGKNILGTSEAFEGYDVDYDKVGGLCNRAEEFIAKIQDFTIYPRPKFNEYSRQIFLEKYSEDAVVEKFQQLLV
jgi:glycosyltransferase involved in cell wall biosynthesis